MMISLQRFLPFLGLAAAACAAVAAAADRPPNLVVILTDDQGYADVGFNGCQDIPTPNLDRIATEGVRCTNGYVTYSVCGPSRAGLITGRYQDRFGACRNPTINPAVPHNGVPLSETNLAELLGPVGYRSIAIGKWHLGTHPDLRPLNRGFDEFFGFLSGGHCYFPEQLTVRDLSEVQKPGQWYRTKILHGTTPVDIDDYLTDALSDAAVEFVERNQEQPFFLYLAYNAPHTPLQATEKYLQRFAHIEDPKRRKYAAMVSAVDDGVGRLLDKLTACDLDNRTIVFYLSDNGGPPTNGSRNGVLRDHKGSPFEGGVRVPFAVRWSGVLPAGGDYDYPVSSLDVAATIVAHCGAEVPAGKPLDGVDLTPYLTGKNKDRPHPALYWRWFDNKRFAARIDDEKLILMQRPRDRKEYGPPLLFDLATDVSETTNVFESRTAAADKATRLLDKWKPLLTDPISPGLGSWKPGS